MNQFCFDSHESHSRGPYFTIAILAATIASFLVLLAVKFTGLGTMLVKQPEPMPTPVQTTRKTMSINDYEQAIIDVVNRVGPSVVMITTNTIVEDFDFFSGPEVRTIQGIGSGVVYRADGYILTNNHVVNSGPGMADKIAVVLSNGKTYPAKVVGVDAQTDLAVLRIKPRNLSAPNWGDSEKIQVGQTAIAIGNPLDQSLKNSVTVGVISSTGRTLVVNDQLQLHNMLQTDASINPGNSGGPLLDSSGSVIGINTIIAAKSQGIGFSIPSNTVKRVANEIIDKGHVSRPGLGLAYIQFSEKNVELLEYQLRRRLPVKTGLFIAKVLKGSGADKAGLLPGDIIVKVNSEEIKDEDLIRHATSQYPIGTKIELELIRNGQRIRTMVKITEMRR